MAWLKRLVSSAAVLALAAGPLFTPGQAAQAAPAPVDSPSPVAQAHAPMPANVDQLDAALAAKDYATLNGVHQAIRTYDDILLFMNWEQVRIFSGAGGVYLSLLYMGDLWNVGTALERAGPTMAGQAVGTKQAAVFMGLYTYQLIVLDGTKCTDSTAVGHRMDQLLAERSEIWSYALQMPDDARSTAVWAALMLEPHTAPMRKDDTVLCQGGLAQMAAGLASGKPPREVANGPGMVGKSYEVETPADFQIGFANPDVWRPEQARLRATMSARLSSLMKLKGPPSPPKS